MLGEILAALVQVIDLVLKKKQYRDQFDDDDVAKNIVQLLVELELIEDNADKIRWYFFYIERDRDSAAQVEKHKRHLTAFIPKQIDALYRVNERIKALTPMLRVYLEDHSLPSHMAERAFSAKQVYLMDIINSLIGDSDDFEFARSETSKEELEKIHAFRLSVTKLIKEQIPVVDFVKWYQKDDNRFERNETGRAREIRADVKS